QFEQAIYKISSEIQKIDRHAYRREIEHLENNHINGLHAQLSLIDTKIESWAKKSLSHISIEGVEITPEDAARKVVDGTGTYEWLDDNLLPNKDGTIKFNENDITVLRKARKKIGSDLIYLYVVLPEIDILPDSKKI